MPLPRKMPQGDRLETISLCNRIDNNISHELPWPSRAANA